MSQITQILQDLDPAQAMQVLLPLVYDELRVMAAQKMAQEGAGHTLQPTALVHEVYLRLMTPTKSLPSEATDREGVHWANRAHFFTAAAEAMRRILIDEARKKLAVKRGGNLQRVEFVEDQLLANSPDSTPEHLMALDAALRLFEEIEPLKSQLVKLRYFAGLTQEDTAQALGISLATAKRHWIYARSWLYGKMRGR
jgi:RNA polymerase sigma factor (TIGR02999 family)